MSVLKVPEVFDRWLVVGAIKVADDPTEIPNKYVVMLQDKRGFHVQTIHFNGREWISANNGRYDLPFSRAVDLMQERAKRYGRPEDADGWCRRHGRYLGVCRGCEAGERIAFGNGPLRCETVGGSWSCSQPAEFNCFTEVRNRFACDGHLARTVTELHEEATTAGYANRVRVEPMQPDS